MTAGHYTLDARAVVQRRTAPLPHFAVLALCRTSPPPEGGLAGELLDVPGYRRQRVAFTGADGRHRQGVTLQNQTQIKFGQAGDEWPDGLFAVLLDDTGQPLACGRPKRVPGRPESGVIQFNAACIKLMSRAFSG